MQYNVGLMPTGVHGPNCIFWANRTPLSLKAEGRRSVREAPSCPICFEPYEGKIHRGGPDFGLTLTVSIWDSQSDRWVSWKIMGQPF